jgi:hypothetical protein
MRNKVLDQARDDKPEVELRQETDEKSERSRTAKEQSSTVIEQLLVATFALSLIERKLSSVPL